MADSTVITLVFEDGKAADRLFDTIEEALRVESFPIDAAAVANYTQHGEVIVKQMVHSLSENGFSTQLWKFLIKTSLSGWGITLMTGSSSSSSKCSSLVPRPSSVW